MYSSNVAQGYEVNSIDSLTISDRHVGDFRGRLYETIGKEACYLSISVKVAIEKYQTVKRWNTILCISPKSIV